MDKLLIATTNEHKIKEIAAIFAEAWHNRLGNHRTQ